MNHARPVVLAVAAVIVALLAWVVLSVATGLIFHLLPAAPILAAMLAYRWASDDERLPWSAATAFGAIGVLAAIAGSVLVRAYGGLLDEPALVVGAIAAGLTLALFLARRPAELAKGSGPISRHPDDQHDHRENRT